MRISFDCAAELYDSTRGPPENAMQQLVKTLINELKGYGSILDAGVGTGRFAKPFQDFGLDVIGVDIAEKMLRKAKEKGVRNLIRSDTCFLPFKARAFDASVEPVKSVYAVTFDNSANELINHLSKRAYSSQWAIPEDVNNRAIAELRKAFSGRTFPAEIRVLVWRISDLQAYCNNF